MTGYLIMGISFAFASAVQPGPLQTYIISQTLRRGWRSTLPAAFAPVISDIPILILVLFLLNTIPDQFLIALKISGGLFLLYLGYGAFKSWRKFDASQAVKEKSEHKTFAKAVVVNLLNPAPYLGWSLIMGPVLLEGWRMAPVNGVAMILGFYITMVLTLAGTIILFGFAGNMGGNVSKTLLGLSAVVLFGFGIYQLWQGIIFFGSQ